MDHSGEKRRRFAENLLEEFSGPSPSCRESIPKLRGVDRSAAFDHTLRYAEKNGLEVVPTCCFSCNTACELLVFIDTASGKVVKIEGDPSSPVTRGVACPKGLAAADLLYNPGRLTKPLRRTNPKGRTPEWKEVEWDDALGEIAFRLLKYRAKDGPESVAFLEGTRRGWSRVFSRFANAFGCPNHGAAGWAQCLWPRLVDCKVTFGAQYTEACDFSNTRCVLVWGSNPASTWPVQAADIMDARERGARLIVVDPRLSETASKADIWLKLKPGTDTDLALGLLHVILEEKLYDAEFVGDWTVGFDDIAELVAPLTPEITERITRVPAGLLREAARAYAGTRPACLTRCVSVDQTADSIQACRATSILAAVTGNIDVPGGNVLVSSRGEISQNSHEFILANSIGGKTLSLRRGYDRYPLLCGSLSPIPSAHMPSLWETIYSGEPYAVKAALVFGSNAAISYTNSSIVSKALDKLEFLAVCDLFMTETAEKADIVLPASSWLERDNVISSFQTSPEHTLIQRKCASVGEARSDVDIICDLARRTGLGDLFWDDSRALYDYLLSPTGMKFEEAAAKRRLSAPLRYGVHFKSGFATPSGKVELRSSSLEKENCDPLPRGSSSRLDEGAAEPKEKFPFVLSTGARSIYFRHTENRRNPWLLAQCPKPLAYINSATAARLGIEEGDLVEISTPTGRAVLHASLDTFVDPDFVQAVPGWGGDSNINLALGWEDCAEGIGTVPMRGLRCDLKKVTRGAEGVEP